MSLNGFEKRKYLPGFYFDLKKDKPGVQPIAKTRDETAKKEHKSETLLAYNTKTLPLTDKKNNSSGIKLTSETKKQVRSNRENTGAVIKKHASPEDDYQTAKRAKAWAIGALACLFLIPYLSIIFAIVAYVIAKKVLVKNIDNPDWKGRKEALFAFRTGKAIIVVSLLIAIALTITLTIGWYNFLLILGFNVVC